MKQSLPLRIEPIHFGQYYEEETTGKRRMWMSTEAFIICNADDRVVDAYYDQAIAEEVKAELDAERQAAANVGV